jgi:formate dehydrogenase alpha subunit
MFHIGSYSHYAKALKDIMPDCIAEINPADARELNINPGDRIIVESSCHRVELPVEISAAIAKGMVYVPKNWVNVPVNLLRNGEEGIVSVKISKAG